MSDNEKTTFGLTIEPPTDNPSDLAPPSRNHLSTIIERDSQVSSTLVLSPSPADSRPSSIGTSPSPRAEYDPANPFSAFYEHGAARRSADLTRPAPTRPSPPKTNVHVYERDIEAQHHVRPSIDATKECSMWPSQKTLLAQKKAQKKARRKCKMCNCWERLSKRNRIILQVLIALFVVGAAVGLGVGISRAVGGGIWTANGQTKQLHSS